MQWFWVHTSCADDLGLWPTTLERWNTTCKCTSQGLNSLFWSPQISTHMWQILTQTNTYKHTETDTGTLLNKNKTNWGLERWLSGVKAWVLFHRSWVHFLAPVFGGWQVPVTLVQEDMMSSSDLRRQTMLMCTHTLIPTFIHVKIKIKYFFKEKELQVFLWHT